MSSNFALFATIGLIVAGSVIAGAAVALTFSTMTSITTTRSSFTTAQTISNTTQSVINPNPTMVSSTPIPTIGLSLHLMLNSTVMLPNHSINITFSIFNTLTTYNNLLAADNWSLPSILDWWPCMGFSAYHAIFQGYYIRSNISGAVPLPLFPPGYSLACPDLNFSSLQFRPGTNVATVIGGTLDGRDGSQGGSFVVTGYYSTTPQVLTNGSSYTILHFKQGAYTVVAGDEWGDLAISNFEVI